MMLQIPLACMAFILAVMKASEPLLCVYWLTVCAYWVVNFFNGRGKHE